MGKVTWEARHGNGTVFTLHADRGCVPHIDAATEFCWLIVVGGSFAARWLTASDDVGLEMERLRRSIGPGSGEVDLRGFDNSELMDVLEVGRKEGA